MPAVSTPADRGVAVLTDTTPMVLGLLLVGHFRWAQSGVRNVSEELAQRLGRVGYRVVTTSARRWKVLRLLDMISTAVRRRHEYSVAHIDVFSGPAFLYAEMVSAVLRWLHKPYVLTLHGGNLPSFGRRWPKRVRHLLQSAAAVTTPSRYLLEHMQRHRADLRVLPNGVEACATPFRLREQPQPHLLWIRSFHQIYNPTMAPAVAARLLSDFPDLRLTMIGTDKGDGSRRETIRVVAGSHVRDRVTIGGAVPKAEVPACMDRADVFLNTTNIDNTPVTVVEAMAAGLPIVSTCAGGIPYLLEHDHDALLVPPGDVEAMAGAVRRVLTEPGLAARLSANARQKAEQFDWTRILPRWQELLAAVAQGRIV